uniref:Immunoglobulin domain-containing protein n=1 Tax=Sinocyclocheilus anshuiensis TaxID=1608454 RepID=A0A671SBF0_9TELE
MFICVSDVPGVETDKTKAESVKEGETVTFDPGVINNPNYLMRWYFNDILITEITGNQSKICTDADERFRDRLKLDHQTESLIITNTRTTDSGDYHLEINKKNTDKYYFLKMLGASCVDIDGVSVMEGDSVTLHTDVKTKQQERIRWYFNDIRIALISGDLSKICTDVQCNKGTERFRDRLQLDHQTGSLTIMNINTTHSGVYKLLIRIQSAKYFISNLKSVKEGESVTLDPAVVKNPNDLKVWYFTDILIAEITGDQSKICTDDQCDERFRDRLKLNKTGSLTITNIRTTDSGLYKLQINSSRFSIIKTYSVSVTGEYHYSTAAAVAAAVVVAVLLVAAAGVIYCHSRRSIQARKNGKYCIQLI